jgi:hypothetical protein
MNYFKTPTIHGLGLKLVYGTDSVIRCLAQEEVDQRARQAHFGLPCQTVSALFEDVASLGSHAHFQHLFSYIDTKEL